jgi:hypothetical protein
MQNLEQGITDHLKDTCLIVSNNSSMDITFSSKMWVFRAFHNDHTIVCHIIDSPFLRFLPILKGKPNDSNEEHKSDGCADCKPNQFMILDHTASATLNVPNMCTSVSLSSGHHTQQGFPTFPSTPLFDKFTLVGSRCKSNFHENTMTFNLAILSHWLIIIVLFNYLKWFHKNVYEQL